MKLEEQVISLELAKKLKELGVKQESLWYWMEVAPDKWRVIHETSTWKSRGAERYSAFTVAELGEMLPTTINNNYDDKTMWLYMRNMHHTGGEPSIYCIWYANGRAEETVLQEDKSEADARAKMLIYLLENKLTIPQ